MGHDPTPSRDDPFNRKTTFWIVSQCVIGHLLLHLKPAGLFLGIFRNGFVYVGSHRSRLIVIYWPRDYSSAPA